jgi:hypothetical protein
VPTPTSDTNLQPSRRSFVFFPVVTFMTFIQDTNLMEVPLMIKVVHWQIYYLNQSQVWLLCFHPKANFALARPPPDVTPFRLWRFKLGSQVKSISNAVGRNGEPSRTAKLLTLKLAV